MVLVGEACGIDRTTGEGIAQAIEMGRIAAAHLAGALHSGSDLFHGYERAVRESTMGRHLLQSALMARVAYRPQGYAARRYLLRSSYARAAGMRWYRGDSIPFATQVRLGLGLAASFMRA